MAPDSRALVHQLCTILLLHLLVRSRFILCFTFVDPHVPHLLSSIMFVCLFCHAPTLLYQHPPYPAALPYVPYTLMRSNDVSLYYIMCTESRDDIFRIHYLGNSLLVCTGFSITEGDTCHRCLPSVIAIARISCGFVA